MSAEFAWSFAMVHIASASPQNKQAQGSGHEHKVGLCSCLLLTFEYPRNTVPRGRIYRWAHSQNVVLLCSGFLTSSGRSYRSALSRIVYLFSSGVTTGVILKQPFHPHVQTILRHSAWTFFPPSALLDKPSGAFLDAVLNCWPELGLNRVLWVTDSYAPPSASLIWVNHLNEAVVAQRCASFICHRSTAIFWPSNRPPFASHVAGRLLAQHQYLTTCTTQRMIMAFSSYAATKTRIIRTT